MNIAAWLISLVAPLVVRGIIALGFTAITLTGLTAVVNQLVSTAQSNWASLPVTVLQLASLSGIPEFLGLVMGAYVARMVVYASFGASKYVFKK